MSEMSHFLCGASVISLPERSSCESCQPVVVIPFEDREQVERLIEAIDTRAHTDCESGTCRLDQMQAALREFANPTPPKPEEPTGLGAVVEDADGKRQWVRWSTTHDLPWRLCEHGNTFPQRWQDINAVRVLSPKPAEPLGLGAVVEDADGVRWVRARRESHQWRTDFEQKAPYHPWDEINAVRVLSEGVTQ